MIRDNKEGKERRIRELSKQSWEKTGGGEVRRARVQAAVHVQNPGAGRDVLPDLRV